MNKIGCLFALALLSPLTVVHAQQPFTGWNGGVHLGFIDGEVKFSDYNKSVSFGAGSSAPQGIIGLSLGYANCFSPCWSWAIEGRVNWVGYMSSWLHADFNAENNRRGHVSAEVTMDKQYALLGKLGYLMTRQLQLYALVGPQRAEFGLNPSTKDILGDTTQFVASGNHSQLKTGLFGGLGLEFIWSGNHKSISAGLEYNHCAYGTISGSGRAHYIGNAIGNRDTYFAKNVNAKIQTNAILMKFNYYVG